MWKKIDMFVLAVLINLITVLPDVRTTNVEVQRDRITVLPGESVDLLCKVPSPLQYCRVVVPGFGTANLHPKATDVANNGQLIDKDNETLKYFGKGLAAGECGATITRVVDKNNGRITCTMGIQTEINELSGNIQLIVAKPPKAPQLDVNRGSEAPQVYKVGDEIQAVCYVRDGRPAARISWFLDETMLTEGLSEPIIIQGVDDLQTVTQNLTRRLRPEDNGKQLRCVAQHEALDGRPSQSSIQLDVRYPPLPMDGPVDLFGYEIGKSGIIAVEISANPRPRTRWTIDHIEIQEGTSDAEGRFEADAVEDLGHGKYIAKLHIGQIRKEDTQSQIRLNAFNELGTNDYTVVISTNTEPQGLELGAGPIVGIVISILLVLLIIFLVIYARASGRWCFGGGSHVIDYTKDSASVQEREGDYESGHHNPTVTTQQEPVKSEHVQDDYVVNTNDSTRNNPNSECSDTESANVESQRKRKFDNLKALFSKKQESPPMSDVTDAPDEENANVEIETPQNEDDDKKEGGLVYAELDLVKTNVAKPLVRKEDEKTEYAEIIYTKNDTPTNGTNKDEAKK